MSPGASWYVICPVSFWFSVDINSHLRGNNGHTKLIQTGLEQSRAGQTFFQLSKVKEICAQKGKMKMLGVQNE